MSVYVDNMSAPFGSMLMCHMWADTDDELLDMADKIGVQRKWIQGHPTLSFGKNRNASWVHFDIAKSKRSLALKFGAVETDRFGPLEHTANLLIATGDPRKVEIGQNKLAAVKECRERRRSDGGSLL
ncbi:DUF4031 domain-containing protein [Brucella anthropi]|uniref:DUF4031 domain-containing protein n=1 Tax=Brucella anthropi TaxID=529 RepID=UPI001E476887|nr:DUF4031 domain-containing protein [Brucella anthropi]UGQ22172.1 DUF4031 domain-containing protein [Brucella anthropi]